MTMLVVEVREVVVVEPQVPLSVLALALALAEVEALAKAVVRQLGCPRQCQR